MGPIRVALVTSSFWPREGGAERQLRRVFSSSAFDGDFVVRVFTESISGVARSTNWCDLEVRRPSTSAARVLGARGSFALTAMSDLSRFRPDIVVSSQVGLATVIAGEYCRLRGIAHIIRLASGGVVPRADGGFSEFPLCENTRKWSLIRPIVSRERCRIVAPAEHLADLVRGVHPRLARNVRWITNGIEDANVLRINELTDARRAPRWDAIWYGRRDWFKNPEAFELLATIADDLSFVALGQKDVATARNIENLGWVDDPLPFIGQSSAALMTSRYEGNPNFALEAIGLGVPVVAFDCNAMIELQSRFPNHVLLAPLGDVTGLATQLRKALLSGHVRETAVIPSIDNVAWEWRQLLVTLVGR